jgi:hypothetical protein
MKITEEAHIFGHFVQWLSLCINLEKNGLSYILGKLFHKLIWSPCPLGTNAARSGPTGPTH